jgi:hypothetical protein
MPSSLLFWCLKGYGTCIRNRFDNSDCPLPFPFAFIGCQLLLLVSIQLNDNLMILGKFGGIQFFLYLWLLWFIPNVDGSWNKHNQMYVTESKELKNEVQRSNTAN